jgi:hypothetical protein
MLRWALAAFLILQASYALAQVIDNGPLISHFPQSFTLWGKPAHGVSLGIDLKALPSDAMPDRQFVLGVCLKNDSDQTVYSVSIGPSYNGLKLKVTDKVGNMALFDGRPRKSFFNLFPIPPGGHLIYYMDICQKELAAIGNNKATVLAQILQQPAPKDPTAPRFTIESPPFQIYPHGPDRSPLPADPVMAQFELEAAQLRNELAKAAGPTERSVAAEQLAVCYVQMGKIAEARDLLSVITDDYDQSIVQMATVYNDTALTAPQKIKFFQAMEVKYPREKAPLNKMIFTLKFQSEHPEKFLP